MVLKYWQVKWTQLLWYMASSKEQPLEPNLKIVLEITSVIIEHDTPEKNNWILYMDTTYFFLNIQ